MTTLSKRFLVVGIIVLAIIGVVVVYMGGLFLTASESTPSVPRPKITIGCNISSLDTVPLIIAYQKGYFRDQGIDVQLVQVQGSEGALAVSSGQVDMVITSAPRLYGPIDKGVPVKILSPMSGTDSELFIRPDSGITSFKDLEGKKVSYGVGGGTKELFLRYILKNEQVDTTKIIFIEIENPYLHIALMEKKDVDVVLISDSHFVDEANKLGAIVLPEWQAKNYRRLPTGLTVSANTDFLNNNEENVTSFFKAIIESHRFLKGHLDESAVIISKYLKDNTDGALDVKPDEFMNLVNEGRVTYILWEDTTTIVELARVSYEAGQVEHVLSLDDLYDLRFKDLLESAQFEIYGTATH